MLRIYDVSLAMLKQVRPVADAIAARDRDHARQLRRSSLSVTLNIAEGSGSRGGTRKQRYLDALGSARETVANLDAAEAIGYVGRIDEGLRGRLDHIIGTLMVVTK